MKVCLMALRPRRSPPQTLWLANQSRRGSDEIMEPASLLLLLSRTGIKIYRATAPQSLLTFQTQVASVVPPLQCGRLCLNSLNQIYVSER